MALESYTRPASTTPVTVNVTAPTRLRTPGSVTPHVPLASVAQVTDEPSLQVPVTVAPLTSACVLSCTVIATVADHVGPSFEVEPSRLPTWIAGGGGAVTVTLVDAELVAPWLSVTVSVTV